MEIEVGILIDTPPSDVWAAVVRIERHVDWMADAERITFRTDRRSGVGTSFECLTRVGPFTTTDVMTVTEWEPGSVMGIEHRGVVTGRGRFRVRAASGDRSWFAWSEELRYPWWMGGPIGEALSRPVLVRIWRANLARLKAIVERG